MGIINMIAIGVSAISTSLIPIAIIFILMFKYIVKFKYLLMGGLLYFVSRSLLFPMIYLFIVNLGITMTPILNAVIEALILAILCVAVKKFFYTVIYRIDDEFNTRISLGLGEGVIECLLFLFPTALNNLLYYMQISNGSIYDYLSSVYQTAEITVFVDTFSNLPISYHWYLTCSVILVIVAQILIAIYTKKSRNAFLCAFVFYLVYMVLPLFGYNIMIMGSLIFSVLGLYQIITMFQTSRITPSVKRKVGKKNI